MAVTWPAFSERVFEFAFNSEYALRNRAVLVVTPSIPTQNAEKSLGYDVLFEIRRRGGAINSIALQHKVSRFVDGESGSNAEFRKLVGLPYLGFGVDGEQHNLIHDVASAKLPGVEFYYCAPLFADQRSMDRHYFTTTIMDHSVWIDIASAGLVGPNESHGLIYSDGGRQAFLCSKDPQRVAVIRPGERRRELYAARQSDDDYFGSLYEITYRAVVRACHAARERRRERGLPRVVFPASEPRRVPTNDATSMIRGTAELLSRYLGMAWLVEVAG